ncbi:hypothetical protein [Vibrio lentus]|uniref:hypothetical protein n=1 Tax=Vibrio lentus TaxID=136468 RepID=UPI003D0ACF6F
MEEVYRLLKKAGHDLNRLADLSSYKTEDLYQKVKSNLGEYSVCIRYSLDAYENFLPFCIGITQDQFDYSDTMANSSWMKEMRDLLEELVSLTSHEFCGVVEFNDVFEDMDRMRQFAVNVRITNS